MFPKFGKSSEFVPEDKSVSEYALDVQKQLLDLGAPEKGEARSLIRVKRAIIVENALAHLRRLPGRRYWRTKQASGRVERLLRLKTEPRPAEIADVAAAHALVTPKLIEDNLAQNKELAASFRSFVERTLVVDPEFHGPQIEAAREIARALGHLLGGSGRA